MKAKAVHICVFTSIPPNAGGTYAPDLLPVSERNLYNAASTAAVEVFQQEGYEGTTLSMCDAGNADFQQFLGTVNASLPFAAIAGTFPDGQKKVYIVKSAAQIKDYLKAMWSGEFGGTGLPSNLGDGDGGWGQGNSLVCQLLPPLCALGFLPWLALAAVTTYKAAESRSKTGKIMWGIPATLFVVGFFERGGVKQIQWWVRNAGISSVPYFKHIRYRQKTKP